MKSFCKSYMHDNTLKDLKQIASDLFDTLYIRVETWIETKQKKKKHSSSSSFETDLTMPSNIPKTAQKNNLSSCEKKAFIHN